MELFEGCSHGFAGAVFDTQYKTYNYNKYENKYNNPKALSKFIFNANWQVSFADSI